MPKAKVITMLWVTCRTISILGYSCSFHRHFGRRSRVLPAPACRAVLDTSGLQAPLNNSACLLCLSNSLWNHSEVLVVGIHG